MNIYIHTIKTISLNNKYTSLYIKIIEKCLERQKNYTSFVDFKKKFGYAEKHHILPKSFKMGGNTDIENYAYLSSREHFIVHKLLVKMFDNKFYYYKMNEALSLFTNNTNRKLSFTSRDYEILKLSNSIAASHRNKGNQNYKFRGDNGKDSQEELERKRMVATNSRWINNGIVESFTRKHEEMILSGEYQYGRLPFSSEHLEVVSKNLWRNKGIKFTEEHCENIRISSITKKLSNRNTSGYKGVNFNRRKNVWRSFITVDRKSIYLGSFPTIEEAIKCRQDAEIKYFGKIL